MVRPSEDDREAVDRAFAEMVAGYHLTADRAEIETAPAPPAPPAPAPSADSNWADAHPLFSFVEAPSVPEPQTVVEGETEPADVAEERYEPEPLPPLRRPGIPALVGWIGIAYAVVIVLTGTFGVDFPVWAGWLGVAGFIGGFGILMSRLPRHRPPGSGDGAVV